MTLEELYPQVVKAVKISSALEALALSSEAPKDTLSMKVACDRTIMAVIKEAGIREILSQVTAHPAAGTALKALAVAAPATAGGAYLLHRAGEESRRTVEDVRNKALQTAGGVALLGGGLLGLNKMLTPKTKTTVTMKNQNGELVPALATQTKMSSVEEDAETLLQKFAAVGYLDTLLEEQEKCGTAGAAEMRNLNAEHGVHILKELLR